MFKEPQPALRATVTCVGAPPYLRMSAMLDAWVCAEVKA
jgi:hypothetical protein